MILRLFVFFILIYIGTFLVEDWRYRQRRRRRLANRVTRVTTDDGEEILSPSDLSSSDEEDSPSVKK